MVPHSVHPTMRFMTVCCLALCSACVSAPMVESSDPELRQRHKSERFYLEVHDGSAEIPDNLDGHINRIWTRKAKRDEVVLEAIARLRGGLAAASFNFVEIDTEASVIVRTTFRSVRLDPVSGWIMDGARIDYVSVDSSEILGTVKASDSFITPTVESVVDALIAGSVELWVSP